MARTYFVLLNPPQYLWRPGALLPASQWPGIRAVLEVGRAARTPGADNDN